MPKTFSVGDWIADRFQVFDVHEGGMGLVYVVNDHLAQRGPKVVALKTLREELLGSRTRVSRFAVECRLWVQLGDHPNIVRAYSVEIIDGHPYVLLELIQGGDLSRWIGTRRLDLAQAVRFGLQFCLGMEHALRQGLRCHRDIKPGNLLVTEDGVLKITDFGLARVCEEMVAVRSELPDGSIPLAEPDAPQPIVWTDPRDCDPARTDQPAKASAAHRHQKGAAAAKASGRSRALAARASTPPDSSRSSQAIDSVVSPGSLTTVEKDTSEYFSLSETADPRLTKTGARLGTGAYMAPEQSRDPASVDARADIYAFGVVLFEMITGMLPFTGKSFASLSRQHEQTKPPSIVPSIPAKHAKLAHPIDEIVQRCLQKDPSDRFSSFAELRLALKSLQAQLQGKPRSGARKA
jgi:serine/threonine protein kinase